MSFFKRHLPIFVFAILCAILFGLDILFKYLSFSSSGTIIPGVLEFEGGHYNTGIAFSFFSGAGIWLTLLVAGLCIGAIVAWWFFGRKSTLASIGFAFFIAGGLANLYCRIFHVGVRDFLIFSFWPGHPIFNTADVFLNVGAVILIIFFLIHALKKDTKKTDA